MKFSHYLLKKLIPEWIKFYINYTYLKAHLQVSSEVKKELRKSKKTRSIAIYRALKLAIKESPLMEKLIRDNTAFITIYENETDKITTFAHWKYNELIEQYSKIKRQIHMMHQTQKEHPVERIVLTWNMNLEEQQRQNAIKAKYEAYRDKKETLLETCYRYYILLEQLQEYADINKEGIRKILKKYKKQELKGVRRKSQEKDYFGNVIAMQKDLKKLIEKLSKLKSEHENQMIAGFYEENPSECREHLRKYTQEGDIPRESIFYFGFFCGCAVVLILLIMSMRINGLLDPSQGKVFNKVFPCFRGMALFLTYYWFISLDLAGWNYFNINYKIYLGFNYHFSTLFEVLQRVSILSAIYLVMFMWYCICVEDSLGYISEYFHIIDVRYIPLITWVIVGVYVFFPFMTSFNPQGRRWMYQMFKGAIWGHFTKYESRFTFFTDQFASMVTPMRDLDYTLCYYHHFLETGLEHNGECDFRRRFTAAQASIIPYVLKCMQYVTRARDKGKFWGTDEMWNFFKTMTSMTVGILAYMTRLDSGFKYMWICVAAFCSCIEYWWDLKKDFLFFEAGSQNRFLRNDLGYNKPWIYYALAFVNFFLRLTWVLTISPDLYHILGINNELFIMLFGFIEMNRRLVNNFLKMEKEHITNLRNLKTVGDLRFPFPDTQEMSELHLIEDHDSVSSLENVSGEESARSLNDPSEATDRQQVQKYFSNLEVPLMQKQVSFRETELQMPRQISFIDNTSNARHTENPEALLKRMPKNLSFENFRQLRRIATNSDFRLTQFFEQFQDKDTIIIDSSLNLETIEKAKQQEKLEQTKTKLLKEENKTYKALLKRICQKYS